LRHKLTKLGSLADGGALWMPDRFLPAVVQSARMARQENTSSYSRIENFD
jgi:hypothetical protein